MTVDRPFAPPLSGGPATSMVSVVPFRSAHWLLGNRMAWGSEWQFYGVGLDNVVASNTFVSYLGGFRAISANWEPVANTQFDGNSFADSGGLTLLGYGHTPEEKTRGHYPSNWALAVRRTELRGTSWKGVCAAVSVNGTNSYAVVEHTTLNCAGRDVGNRQRGVYVDDDARKVSVR